MSDSPAPRPGTTASLEARVERLERQYDALNSTVTGMAIDVAVTRTHVESVNSGIADLKTTITTTLAAMSAAASDPSATAAGKLIEQQISTLRLAKEDDHREFAAEINETKKEVAGLRLWVAAVVGAASLAIFLINLIAPVVQRAIGIHP